MSSSAALPPMHTSIWARICWRVTLYSSFSGTWLTMPSACPRGTMVACEGGAPSGGGVAAAGARLPAGLRGRALRAVGLQRIYSRRWVGWVAAPPPRAGRTLWMGLAPGVYSATSACPPSW